MKEYIDKIIESMNLFLASRAEGHVSKDDLLFAMDADLSYQRDECSVSISKIFTIKDFDRKVSTTLLEGPSWIHANLIRSNQSKDLIAIRFGAAVGNPAPAINLSIEKKKLILIPE